MIGPMLAHVRNRLAGQAAAILLALTLGAAGHAAVAAPTTVGSWSTDTRLNDWLERDLAPYLTDVFSQHPRFRNQALRFVSLRGNATDVEMDELTRSIVLRLRQSLQKTPGIRLWWPPSVDLDTACSTASAPDYDIAIEVLALDAGRHRIAVRALDLAERRWVSGFGNEWQGQLTRSQRAALAARDATQDALGKRNNPYTERQADLLARALARELSAQLCGIAGAPAVVYLDESENASVLAARVTRLLGHNLSAARDVIVTDDIDAANLRLRTHVVAIDGELHQIWVSTRPTPDAVSQTDVHTQAYLRFAAKPGSAPATSAQVEPASVASRTAAAERPTLASLELIAPSNSRHCARADPWRFGQPLRLPGLKVDAHGCFALELRARQDVLVFLLRVDSRAGAQRLLPSACRTFGRTRSVMVRGERLRFPVTKNAQRHVFRAPGHDGSQRFLAVAASDHAAAQRIKTEVALWSDACATQRRVAVDPTRSEDRLARLRELVAQLAGRAELQQIEVRFVTDAATLAVRDDGRQHDGRTQNE